MIVPRTHWSCDHYPHRYKSARSPLFISVISQNSNHHSVFSHWSLEGLHLVPNRVSTHLCGDIIQCFISSFRRPLCIKIIFFRVWNGRIQDPNLHDKKNHVVRGFSISSSRSVVLCLPGLWSRSFLHDFHYWRGLYHDTSPFHKTINMLFNQNISQTFVKIKR